VPGLVALGCAAQETIEARDFLCTETARLRDKLEDGIVSGFPDAMPFFKSCERLPNCTTIGFPGIFNEALLFLLNRKGVYASIGGGNFQQISTILTSCGFEERLAHSAICFSLSRYTTEDEIDRAIEFIVDAAIKLRKTSINVD
jgi:cysteine desulfurase